MTKVKLAASLGALLVWLLCIRWLVSGSFLIQETLPSWFLSVHGPAQDGGYGGMGAIFAGIRDLHTLHYVWNVCTGWIRYHRSKRRPKVIGATLNSWLVHLMRIFHFRL
ncbi:hypothetical protein IFM89_008276 [Coptis chinensis]|uniref:Uncharacterized protein n=1 Tax=Coptis chinensis TaxID=261450 RepID=A0A835LI57_9MAGN|nr:hypothetical protein IFM89_008276 [Coptis chinensis]